MSTEVKQTFDGVEVSLGGKPYVIPPLSLKLIRKYQSQLQTIGVIKGVPGPEQLDLIFDILHDAILRNYPDMTKDTLEELVDITNMPILFKAIMGQSGLEEKVDSKK